MKKITIALGILITCVVLEGQGQKVGRQNQVVGRDTFSSGLQASHQHGESLKTGAKNSNNQQAKLDKQSRRQARIDKQRRRQERKKQRLAKEEAAKLKASKGTDFEQFDNAAGFNNLQAEANKNVKNKFGLSLVSENLHSEDAAIKQNDGQKASSGTKLAHVEDVDAAQFFNAEVIDEAEILDEDGLSAAAGNEDVLSAAELRENSNQEFVDAVHKNDQFLKSEGSAQANQQSGFNEFGSSPFFGAHGFGGNAFSGFSSFKRRK